MLILFANLGILLTFTGALVFVVSYSWLTRNSWRNSRVGWNMMVFMAVIMLVSALAVAGIVWGRDWPARDLIRFLTWAAVGSCIWWRVVLLRRAQRPPHPATPPEAMTTVEIRALLDHIADLEAQVERLHNDERNERLVTLAQTPPADPTAQSTQIP